MAKSDLSAELICGKSQRQTLAASLSFLQSILGAVDQGTHLPTVATWLPAGSLKGSGERLPACVDWGLACASLQFDWIFYCEARARFGRVFAKKHQTGQGVRRHLAIGQNPVPPVNIPIPLK